MPERNLAEEIIKGLNEAIVYVRDQSSDFLDSFLEEKTTRNVECKSQENVLSVKKEES